MEEEEKVLGPTQLPGIHHNDMYVKYFIFMFILFALLNNATSDQINSFIKLNL